MVKYEIKHLDPFSVGKVTAVVAGILGLINGILASLTLQAIGGIIGPLISSIPLLGASEAASGAASTASSLLAGLSGASIIAFPILSLIIGFLGGIIGALIYNLTASVIGGIHAELNLMEEKKPEKK